MPFDRENVGMLVVKARERANAVGREKFVLVEHELQDAPQLLCIDDGQQAALALARACACRRRWPSGPGGSRGTTPCGA